MWANFAVVPWLIKWKSFARGSESAVGIKPVSRPAAGSHSEKEEEDLQPLVLTSTISRLSQQFCETQPISTKQVERKQAMNLHLAETGKVWIVMVLKYYL